MLGAQVSPYLQKGETELTASYRHFTADHHYRGGSELNQAVTSLKTQVISKMRFLEFGATYAVNQQFNLTLGVPYIAYASSNRALPATVAGSPRFAHTSTGFGDVTVGGRYWLLDCDSNPNQNIGIGLSLKIPTGDNGVKDLFPNGAGQDLRVRPVDQSIQPGDGGWGFIASFEWFKGVRNFTLFAHGAYLFNPRGQNRTISPPALLNPNGPTAVNSNFRFNTVNDSYIARIGVGYPISFLPGAALLFAGRLEGVPETDLLGETIGFRRPGYFVSVEPGITYSTGITTFSFSVPLRVRQYVQDSFGAPRDSTFADRMFLFSVSYRFGGDGGIVGVR